MKHRKAQEYQGAAGIAGTTALALAAAVADTLRKPAHADPIANELSASTAKPASA